MCAKLLEGKPIAERIKQTIKQDIQASGKKLVLASIMVGDNAGVLSYVKSQQKTTEALGIEYRLHNLESSITEVALIEFIQKLNQDKSVNGIIIQMPLPSQIDYK